MQECTECNGEGTYEIEKFHRVCNDAFEPFSYTVECETCGGIGEVEDDD